MCYAFHSQSGVGQAEMAKKITFRAPILGMALLSMSVAAWAQGAPDADLTIPPGLRGQGYSSGAAGAPETQGRKKAKQKTGAVRTGKSAPAPKPQGSVETDSTGVADDSAKGPDFAPSINNSGAGFGFRF
jgi:hypothetical protein